MEFLLLVIVFLLIAILFLTKNVIRENRRKKVMKNPFPREWENYLKENYTLFSKMPAELQHDMKNNINIFLNEKIFFGCEGLEITDQIRVLIAAYVKTPCVGGIDHGQALEAFSPHFCTHRLVVGNLGGKPALFADKDGFPDAVQ